MSCRSCTENGAINCPCWVFIHNGREITTWMGVKLQNRKHKIQSNIFKITFFESPAAVVRQLTKAAIFVAAPIKRHLGVYFTKICFFLPICWQKSRRFNAKVLLACWRCTKQVIIFSSHNMDLSSELSHKCWVNVNH